MVPYSRDAEHCLYRCPYIAVRRKRVINFFSDIASKPALCSESSFSVIKGFNPLNCKFVTCVHAGELRCQKPLDTNTQYTCASKYIWCQPNNNPMPQVGGRIGILSEQKTTRLLGVNVDMQESRRQAPTQRSFANILRRCTSILTKDTMRRPILYSSNQNRC